MDMFSQLHLWGEIGYDIDLMHIANTKVLIQGGPGSFHEMAAKKLLPGCTTIPKMTFVELFEAFNSGEADLAVVATMNSNFGDIDPMYRELSKMVLDGETKFWITAATAIDVHQCLIGLRGSDIGQIKHVHSMAPALGQCSDYLDKNLPDAERVEENDTAESVRLITQIDNPSHAAIASQAAAELYNAQILATSIQNDSHNRTRFVLLSRRPKQEADDSKLSILLETSNHAGSLYRALGLFAEFDINLTYLRSQTIPGSDFRQMFYIDVEIGGLDARLQSITDGLSSQGAKVTILGSYKEK